jgi:hypothetical protein
VAALLDSNQRINMYIGVKSDLFQLGMVLYALAIQDDEPESKRPFDLSCFPHDVPEYYVDMCRRCLDPDPRGRSQAEVLLQLFPPIPETVHERKTTIPIIVDARHVDDDFSNVDSYLADSFDRYRKPRYQYRPGLGHPGGYGYAPTNATDESEYYRGRGRSPPSPWRRPLEPYEIPLPPSHTESECLDTTRDSIPTQNRVTEVAPSSAQKDEPGEGTQHIEEPGEPQHPAGAEADEEEAPQTTAAASQMPTALPTVLAGVGSAYWDLEIQPTSLDDDDYVPDNMAEGSVETAQS